MKTAVIISALVMFCMCAVPLCQIDKGSVEAAAIKGVSAVFKEKAEEKSAETFRIKIQKTGKIKNLSAEEYITGVLCGEVSPNYSPEALKAQAVAAYTFALYRKAAAKDRDFDLTDSPATDQCYIDKETYTEKSGKENYEIMRSAVKSVKGEYLAYGGKPLLAVYHAVSSGVTENAADVWGGDYPYLKSVDSIGDKLSASYLSEVTFSAEDIAEKCEKLCAAKADGNFFSDIKTLKSGRVSEIKYRGKTVSGSDIQKALSLKSANFTVDFKDGNYTFTVKGYGHGVGMSQTGAEYMAKQGSNYKEILLHYYSGAELV